MPHLKKKNFFFEKWFFFFFFFLQGFPDYEPPKYVTDAMKEASNPSNHLLHQYARSFVSILSFYQFPFININCNCVHVTTEKFYVCFGLGFLFFYFGHQSKYKLYWKRKKKLFLNESFYFILFIVFLFHIVMFSFMLWS